MTARLKAMEERYQTRLFHRSTRAITLTNAGKIFIMPRGAYWRRRATPSRC
jgi:DNA-binding transcriptional LysR family regulator